MTKFKSLYLFLLSAFVLLIVACQPPKEHGDSISQETIDSMKTKHIIPLNEAVAMYKKYGTDRVDLLSKTLEKKYNDSTFRDTRMVWFDIESIKTYLNYLEKNASDAEGLQFYFSVNSDKAAEKNSQTFFIAPTVKQGDHQSGFTYYNGERVFLYEAFKRDNMPNTSKAGFFALPLEDDDGYLYNSGKPNPPGNNN